MNPNGIIDLIPIGTLGSLRVYTFSPSSIGTTSIFWCDDKDPQGYGPFRSIYECLSHWQWRQGERKAIEAIDPNKVVHVNFSEKKRI